MGQVTLQQFEAVRQLARQKLEQNKGLETRPNQDWKNWLEKEIPKVNTTDATRESRTTQSVNALENVNGIRGMQQYAKVYKPQEANAEETSSNQKRLLGNYIDIVG